MNLRRPNFVSLSNYFIVFSMLIVTLYSYQNSAIFQTPEIWVLGLPLSCHWARLIVKIQFEQYINSRYSFWREFYSDCYYVNNFWQNWFWGCLYLCLCFNLSKYLNIYRKVYLYLALQTGKKSSSGNLQNIFNIN